MKMGRAAKATAPSRSQKLVFGVAVLVIVCIFRQLSAISPAIDLPTTAAPASATAAVTVAAAAALPAAGSVSAAKPPPPAPESTTAATGREHQEGAAEGCPNRRPYHTVLTTQATVYQQWQSRIMYYHWKKQAAVGGACSEMSGFTRLVASEGGEPDGLESEMPSVFVAQLTTEMLAKHGQYGVLNRPHSVKQMIDSGALGTIREAYVYIAETDHVLMKPLPNMANETTPSAYPFGYMHPQFVQPIIERFSPGTSWQSVQPIGPSPVIVAKAQLEKITPLWLELSLQLKRDPTADRRFGWVLEMWAYSIASAQLGIVHRLQNEWQIEPAGAGRDLPRDDKGEPRSFIFHYTYGMKYSPPGRPGTATHGEVWSLDKRQFLTSYPPRALPAPPAGASESATWLCAAWNEASEHIPTWPDTNAPGTVSQRRPPPPPPPPAPPPPSPRRKQAMVPVAASMLRQAANAGRTAERLRTYLEHISRGDINQDFVSV